MNQTQATAEPSPVSIEPVDASLWRTYDEGGWQQLKEHDYVKAQRYFEKAQKHAAALPERDFRRGRTLAGLAWVIYRTAARKWNDQRTPAAKQPRGSDPEQLFRQAHDHAEHAKKLLAEAELPDSERKYLAYTHHILGLTQIELCKGQQAEQSLQCAGEILKSINDGERYFEVLHYLAKLKQCRRNYVQAAQLLQRVFQEASDTERRVRALLDLANVWTWNGYVREAQQLESVFEATWQQLETEVAQDPGREMPIELEFRGRLIFARVALLYGDYEKACQLLRRAQAILCGCTDISPICRAVFWIVSAELALERGDHE